MRSLKMVPTIAVAMVLLTLAPVAAPAANAHASRHFRHFFFPGHCRIDIEVAPREITAGDPVRISGRLNCRNSGREANRVVMLFHHLPGSSGFGYVQSTMTNAQGFYSFTRADGVVDTNRSWYVRSYRSHSAAKRIRVAARVTLSGPAEGAQLLTGRANQVTFTGTVSPANVGARVILERQNAANGPLWHRIDRGIVQPGGVFSIMHTFLVPGDASIRVLVRSEGRNIPSSSNVLHYTVAQGQSPALTILASADPITMGQPVTISGVLAGGANQQMTLFARLAHRHRFKAIAQVNTDALGAYSFPAQTPPRTTIYEVAGAGQTSTPLWVGVHAASSPLAAEEDPEGGGISD